MCGVVLALSLGSTASVKPVPCGSLHPSSPDQHTGFCHQSLSKENQDLGFPGRAATPLLLGKLVGQPVWKPQHPTFCLPTLPVQTCLRVREAHTPGLLRASDSSSGAPTPN